MNTYIQVFKNKSKHRRLYLIICFGFIIISTIGLFMTYLFDIRFIPFINEGGYFALLLNSIISFFIVIDSMKKSKYFVSWNEREINYFLPKSDEVEIIKIKNIKSIDFNRSNITIELDNSETKNFNLNYFFYPERKTIISLFENLKK